MNRRIFKFLIFFQICSLLCLSVHAYSVSDLEQLSFQVTNQDTLNLSKYMNFGRAMVVGQWYYGPIKTSGNYANLGKFKLNDSSEKTVLSTSNQQALYVSIHKGWIYYVNYDEKIKEDAIYKMRISGENKQLIVPAETGYKIGYMLIYDGNIFYSENKEEEGKPITGSFIRIDLNGKNKKRILNKPTYYPYIIDGKLIYQDDRDFCRLHIYDIDNDLDHVLIDDVVFSYCINDRYIVYHTYNVLGSADTNGNMVWPENKNNIIKRYNRSTGKIETIVDENTNGLVLIDNIIYYCNYDDNQRLYSYNLTNGNVDLLSQNKYMEIIGVTSQGIFCKKYSNDKWSSLNDIYYITFDTYNTISIL